jgi:hypothetical protein
MGYDHLSEAQRGLLELLRANSGKSVTRDEVLTATGWKAATLKAYLSKGHLVPFLSESSDGQYSVKTGAELDEWTFARQMTQSGSVRELGAPCRSNLARALVRKARDNIVLGLELYNRPTLENRLDAFCMMFCTAWEQLLKAEIIESEGEDVIYTEVEDGKRPKTISLEKALDKRLAANDPVRANVLAIAELRHGATHLLMPEVQSVLSRLFQAGVINFAKRFPSLGGMPLFPSSSSGLMSLISDPEKINVVALRQMYGEKTAKGILDLVSTLDANIEKTQDERFAIGVEYRLVLTKSESKADIRLTTAAEADGNAAVVEKAVPVDKIYPYSMGDVALQLSSRLSLKINGYDVQAMLAREKWKVQNNDFHHYTSRFKLHQYSEQAITVLADKISADPQYLPRARSSLRAAQRKAKTQGSA